MKLQPEICADCGREIKGRAVANVLNGRILCTWCYKRATKGTGQRAIIPSPPAARPEERLPPEEVFVPPTEPEPPRDSSSRSVSTMFTITLSCPNSKCGGVIAQNLTPAPGWQRFQCVACGTGVQSRMVKIRAKNSRGNRQNNSRDFNVRVIDAAGREDLVQFWSAAWDDYELRSGDSVVFTHDARGVYCIYNATIRRVYYVVRPVPTDMTVIYVVFAIFGVAVVILLCGGLLSHR